jgi:hypothetical protein
MSNIVGEGFAREIREQVSIRQKIYNSANVSRTNEQLLYLNANAGWVRLASSVDINAQIRDFPANLKSSNLAKQYVLFGGIQGVQGTDFNNIHSSAFNTEAYGIGGTEFGIRPMPGIKSAQIKTLTRGSLKEATIQITANNRTQFDIIDILYLRLGFTMLLEWGHASYFDNEGKFVENNPYDLYTEFLNGKLGYNNILDKIQEFRLESDGNYDAIAGKVVNFNWQYNRDGSYSITLILRSLGDVIESLKANILLGDKEAQYSGIPLLNAAEPAPQTLNLNIAGLNQSTQTQIPLKSLEPIEPAKIANEIDRLFYNLKKIIDSTSFSEKRNLMKIVKDNGKVNYFGQGYSSSDNINYYIRLGYFLQWIERNLVPYVNNDENSRLIKFDTNAETNLIYLDGLQISADPRICTFNRTFDAVGSNGEKFGTTTFSGEAELFEIKKGTTFSYGKIMNAYFNMDDISSIVKNLQSTDTGEIAILDLIRTLCNRWNQSTGRVNRLDIIIDPDTNRCKIVDETSIPGKDRSILFNNLSLPVETAKFLTYRSLPETGSTFIKKIDFTTQIPHNFATLITIGSTAQGYVLGADATALSRMNAGLTDRTKTTISSPGSKDRQDISLEEKYKSALEAFNAFKLKLSFFKNSGTSDPPEWDQQSIETFSSLQSQLIEYKQALQVVKNQTTASNASSPNMGFLPFNLSLTMDGLSGMKVYQKFEVDTDFLPSNYPTSLDFIVKGITHTIQNNEWITNIESFAIPANPFGTELGQIVQQQRASRNLITNVDRFNQELIRQAITFFKNQGFPDTSVAGIIGNLLVESGLNTNALGDNGTAYGIAQWRFDRQDKLKKKYPGPTNNYTTLNSQLNWIIDELNTNQFKPVLSALKEPSTTVDIATSIFDRKYEISNGASLEQRKLYAKDIYDKIQNKTFK